jgi:putative ABC transport system ATP-binding protein
VLSLLRRAVDEFGQTVVMVTHDPNAAAVADRVVVLVDGKIVEDAEPRDAARVHDLLKLAPRT